MAQKKTITLVLDELMIKKIDRLAQEEFTNRSDFIRQAVAEKMRQLDGERLKLAIEAGMPEAALEEVPTEDDIFEYLRMRQGRRAWQKHMREVDKLQRHGRPSLKE